MIIIAAIIIFLALAIVAIVMGVREDKSHSAKAPRDEDKDKK